MQMGYMQIMRIICYDDNPVDAKVVRISHSINVNSEIICRQGVIIYLSIIYFFNTQVL